MIIPIRCFTCGKVIADKYDYYIKEAEKLKLETPSNMKDDPKLTKEEKKAGKGAN